ncbi:MAG: hypothetical protein D6701_00540, partial [Gemmatimonadetes bacterium]
MRFVRLRIDAFGGLGDVDTGPEPLGPLVVVYGPNEAGKSTLFRALRTLLYGFHPASRDANPDAPWSGRTAEVAATVASASGECSSIHRRLLSSPRGRWSYGDEAEDLANRPLPLAAHVPQRIFEQAFALTLVELAELESETWARIQDRLLTGFGAGDLVPARDAAKALEAEALAIWRPDRKGKPVLRRLDERRKT